MSVAVLFPGQGSQRTGMLQSLPDTPAAAQAHTEARDVLRSFDDVPAQLDTFEALHSTTNTQLALLIAGVVTARALVDDHDLRADSVAGHSVGAFSAAVIAGVLSLSDALRVVRVRGHGMERACANGAWSMAALSGLNLASTRQLLATIATDADPLWVANINAADQIVVSGTRTALDTLRRRAPAAGVRDLKLLDVSVASHCPCKPTPHGPWPTHWPRPNAANSRAAISPIPLADDSSTPPRRSSTTSHRQYSNRSAGTTWYASCPNSV